MNTQLGKTIQTIRQERRYSIKELAEMIGVSSSLLSQIERNLSNPSLNTLREIAEALEVPMFSLFVEEDPHRSKVVKKEERTVIQNSNTEDGIVELLSPDLQGDIQLCSMTLSPGQSSSANMHSHNGEEVALCNSGTLTLHLLDETIVLDEGDSVRLRQGTDHRWSNKSDENTELVFAITPPIF